MTKAPERLRNLAVASNDGNLRGPVLQAADTIEALQAENELRRRFWDNTVVSCGCWKWTGSIIAKDGRGTIYHNGKTITAPRVAWFVCYGDFPGDGVFVCHSCDNPNCVNPAHLWLGSNTDNLRDASRKGRLYGQDKTKCKRGHSLSGENVFITSQGHRSCRTCQREHNRAYQSKPHVKKMRREAQRRRAALQQDKEGE